MDSNTSQPDVNAESKYSGIYIVMGIPGGGKTTMAAKQVTKICETIPRDDDEASPVAVCSMTKAAAREIASRDLPIPDWQVGTLHSMAYRQIGSPPVAEAEAKDFNDGHGDFAISAERDLDDTTGEAMGYAMERLLAAGALDVWFTPIQMKKNRPAVTLNVLAEVSRSRELAERVLRETSTLGVRLSPPLARLAADRRLREVATRWGSVRIKEKWLDGRLYSLAPEFEDCARLARENGVAWEQVRDEALRAAQD